MFEIRASRDIKKDNTQAPAMHGLVMKGLHHRAAQRVKIPPPEAVAL